MKLLSCPHCGQMYKIIKQNNVELITDYDDKFNKNHPVCIKCNTAFILEENILTTDDWIADLVFKVKG